MDLDDAGLSGRTDECFRTFRSTATVQVASRGRYVGTGVACGSGSRRRGCFKINQHRVQQVKLAVRTGTVRTAQTLSPRLRLAKIFELWRR